MYSSKQLAEKENYIYEKKNQTQLGCIISKITTRG